MTSFTTSICHAVTFLFGSFSRSWYPTTIGNLTNCWWTQAAIVNCLHGSVISRKNGVHWKNDQSPFPSMMHTDQILRNGLVPAWCSSSATFSSVNTLSRMSTMSHQYFSLKQNERGACHFGNTRHYDGCPMMTKLKHQTMRVTGAMTTM